MAITRITRGSSQESDASTSRQKRARIYKDSTPTISRGHRHKTSTSELDRILEQSEPELPYQKEHTGPADRVRRSDGSNLSGTTVLGGSDHDPDPFEVAKKHVQLLMASSGLDPAALIQVLSQEAGVTMNNGATVKKAPAAKRAPRKRLVEPRTQTVLHSFTNLRLLLAL